MQVRRNHLIAAIGLGILLNPLNSSMVAVAISRLEVVFGLQFTEVSWIISVFYLASAIAQPVMGRLSDLWGRKRIFLAGLAVVFVSSALSPLSPNFGTLLFFRAMGAVGTSMLGAVGLAIVRAHVSEKQANALALLSVFLNVAAAIGPAIGGLLILNWDWPTIFLVNFPFVVGSFVLAVRSIPNDPEKEKPTGTQRLKSVLVSFDALGIVLFSLGLPGLLAGLLSTQLDVALPLIIVGSGLLTVFLFHELRTPSPLIPLRTFLRFTQMTKVNLQFVAVNLIFYSVFFGFPAYLQSVLHLHSGDVGFLMIAIGACSLAISPWAAKWIERSGPRPALLASGSLVLAGSLSILFLGEQANVFFVVLTLSAFGLANGLNNVGIQIRLFQVTPKEIAGVASGLFLTSRYLGTIFSSIILGSIFKDRVSTFGFHLLGIVLSICSVLFIASVLVKEKPAMDDSALGIS